MPLYRTTASKPKAVKVVATLAQATPTIGVNTGVQFDVTQFNYGGFTIVQAARITGVRTPEAGIFYLEGHVGFAANSQTFQFMVAVNGSALMPDNTIATFNSGATASNGAFEVAGFAIANVELAVNDLIEVYYNQNTAAVQPGAATYSYLYVEKKPR